MPTGHERSRRQNAWRIESLEDRNLLSMVRPAAQIHALTQRPNSAPKPVRITASFKGTSHFPSDLTQVTPIIGSGRASRIGKFTAIVTPSPQGFSQGNFTIQIARGGSISGEYSGTATSTKKSSVERVQLSGPIKDGTTPFEDASGTFSATATANLATSQVSGTIKLSFSHT